MENEQKENHFFEPHKRMLMKTPLKESSTSNTVLTELQPGPLTTPTKPKETSPGEPWTPTANLKMLISAASPEIRNREQKKGLSGNQSGILEAKDCLHEHLSGDEFEKSQPSRKEKSLGLLCHKFLARYPNYPNPAVNNDICLDEVAEELNVERRRIYDIVNVLESLHMVSRLAKNRYTWHGRHNLNKTLGTLKNVGEENKYAEQIMMIKKREYEQEFDFNSDKNEENLVKPNIRQNGHTDMCFIELPGVEFRAASVNSRKDKSLRVMSQKFVMLFLVSTPQVVSLEIAAKILIGEDHIEDLDKSKFKTKIRRLYDIANVLSSLELIKKVHVTEERGRKPAFKWTGPEICTNSNVLSPVSSTPLDSADLEVPKSSKEQCAKNLFSSSGKPNFTRHPSLIKLVKSIESDRRKINSAPSSPIKTNKGDGSTSSAPFPNKMAQLAAICKMQLEEQSSVTGNPSSIDSKSKVLTNKITTEKAKNDALKTDDTTRLGNSLPTPERQAIKSEENESASGKHLKRSNVLEDNISIKKFKEDLKGLENLSATLIPTGYLIPLAQCSSLGTESILSNKESPGACSPTPRIYNSPIAGVIPVTAPELTAVNFSSFHVTPLKLMVSPTSVAAVPVVSSPSLASGHSVPAQNPSSTIVNFTLQNLGLISPSMQVSASPGPAPVPVSPQIERISTASENGSISLGKTTKHDSPGPGQNLVNGQSLSATPVPQPVPLTPKGSQLVAENFFRTPGGPTKLSDSSSTNSNGASKSSLGNLFVPQRKLEVSSEDVP
ncbi:transcription factor E2F8 isoform X2 [Tachyglossus aculeatus]|uniref:transcription factor E2F8 isoform X2 n=1 Tax=Tachyglossus aculeatus TaxID=9261 RepID=UPI0018F28A29|nr:transcription factor E2F8 isoform X2 [Tachyglossus aculeatus]